MGRSLRTAVVALAFIVMGTSASADPVRVVTSGGVGTGNYDTGFAISGPGLTFMASHWLEPLVNCAPCTPGSTFDVSSTLLVQDWAAGRAWLDGNAYDPVFFSGAFTFRADPVIVPDMPPGQSGPDAQGLTRVLTPFTMTGTLMGYADADRTGAPLFSTELIGGGRSVVSFSNYPPEGGIRVLQLDYGFENVAPTPEPGSLLLFGTGAAWVAAKCRKTSRSTPRRPAPRAQASAPRAGSVRRT